MAQKKRRRKPARKQQQEPYPGWMWMLFGLAIGLSVAAAIYVKDRENAAQRIPTAQQPASMAAPIAAESEPASPAPEPAATEPQEDPGEDKEPRFTFYSMLPNFEVVVPEEELDVSRDNTVEAIEDPGTYVLQAGSFTDVTDADRRRAELALLGIESRVQRVTIDDRTYHRVRIGPMDDLDQLNLIRSRLRQSSIDVLRIKLGE